MLPTLPSYELERLADECEAAGVGAEYRALLAKGTFAREAAMYALQAAPGSRNTDRAFCEGARRQMESMPASQRKDIQEIAKQAGINTDGKFYKGSIGKYNDPAAWVSSADDVLAVCKARNANCDGVISYKAVEREAAPPKRIPLAPDIVQRLEKSYLQSDPSLAAKVKRSRKARGELREKIVATHGNTKRR